MAKQYWLFKTEPTTYSIDDFSQEEVTEWWGIRNYQVRNFIRDTMHSGDEVLIKSKKEAPTWLSRDIQFVEKFREIVTLVELKEQPELKGMLILRPGNRLSITPLTEGEFTRILALAKNKK
jgi:predicted RNA-binding protein with PUA-like domain